MSQRNVNCVILEMRNPDGPISHSVFKDSLDSSQFQLWFQNFDAPLACGPILILKNLKGGSKIGFPGSNNEGCVHTDERIPQAWFLV